MSAKRRLVPLAEVEQHLLQLKKLGVLIGAVDIRSDGVTIYPPGASPAPGNDFDRWQAQDAHRDKTAPR